MTLRLLSYNIRHGGVGRVERDRRGHPRCRAGRRGAAGGDAAGRRRAPRRRNRPGTHGSHRGQSLGFLSRASGSRTRCGAGRAVAPRVPRARARRRTTCRSFGVHLSAVHAAWTERRRLIELRVAAADRDGAPARVPRARRRLQHARARANRSTSRRLPRAAAAARLAERRIDPLEDDRGGAWRPATPTPGGRCIPTATARRSRPGAAPPARLRVRAGAGRARVIRCEVVTDGRTIRPPPITIRWSPRSTSRSAARVNAPTRSPSVAPGAGSATPNTAVSGNWSGARALAASRSDPASAAARRSRHLESGGAEGLPIGRERSMEVHEVRREVLPRRVDAGRVSK